MPTEIERKFLVKNDGWQASANAGTPIKQGYLSTSKERNVRVRQKGEKALLNVKGNTEGISRLEFEYEIALDDALEMLALCEKPLIEKTRFLVAGPDGNTWELDVFEGDNQGLIVAEIELENEEAAFALPDWAGEEVSHDSRYFNANLNTAPYKTW